ncbi:LAFE_0A05490g1_1 [Lachancea fermentati]|uniref:LAFE_0A05490g1_1 n=1 Tax=Lachancea fermentati TaxID=4955 RepID=A0A1G4M6Z2_LACFM|nr:LAFE_0A05490g1_1 [Lachancea fermentati]
MGAIKRSQDPEEDPDENSKPKRRPTSAIMGISRSIAACKRCRFRKVKCDQKFPSCSKCVAADEPCVSVDPATGRDVPRSYVIFLEDRLEAMMKKLQSCGIDPSEVQGNIPATSDDRPCNVSIFEEKMRLEHEIPTENVMAGYIINNGTSMQKGVSVDDRTAEKTFSTAHSEAGSDHGTPILSELGESSRSLTSLGAMKHSKASKSSMGNASNSYLGDSSGIPFAKLMFTAVNFKPDAVDESNDEPVSASPPAVDEPLNPLYLPTKREAQELISRYFAYCNSQLPILHREYFLKKYFEPIYGQLDEGVSLASDHTLINKDFKLVQQPQADDSPTEDNAEPWYEPSLSDSAVHDKKVPVKFYLPLFFLNMVFAVGDSAQVLESSEKRSAAFKNRASHFIEALFCSNDRLEALAGTLLIAEYSIMRPNVPGVWYTMGSALRLAVDLGLHAEKLNKNYEPFTRDLRRRLFWSTYSLDRQICAFFGRPFGIPDENVTAEFPSSLDDALITTAADNIEDYSFVKSSVASYKSISLAFFKIRKIQAQIVQVLYAPHGTYPQEFTDLEQWRSVMNHEINTWYSKLIPKTHRKMNCKFRTEFFQLNYCHTKIMLYGLCPKSVSLSPRGYEVVYQSTKGIIDAYYKLCTEGNINYTWVAVHNLFMAGMTFLYTIHNAAVGIVESITELQKSCFKLVHVLKSLIGTCDAAKNCSKIFQVLSAAVLKLRMENEDSNGPIDPLVTYSEPRTAVHSDSAISNIQMSPGQIDAPLDPLENINTGTLDQFFVELDKLSPFSDTSKGQFSLSSFNSPESTSRERIVNSASRNSKTSDLPSNGPRTNDETASAADKFTHQKRLQHMNKKRSKDSQRVYDLIHQVSTETIWDQFFSNRGGGSNGFNNPGNPGDFV